MKHDLVHDLVDQDDHTVVYKKNKPIFSASATESGLEITKVSHMDAGQEMHICNCAKTIIIHGISRRDSHHGAIYKVEPFS